MGSGSADGCLGGLGAQSPPFACFTAQIIVWDSHCGPFHEMVKSTTFEIITIQCEEECMLD